MNKRAQSEGTSVAVILIVIALFMTLYILFIPPADREALLNSSSTDSDTLDNNVEASKIELLAESPGLVTPLTESSTIHRIPSVNVFLRDEPKIISLAQNLFVSNGAFSDSFPTLRFKTEDLDETNKVTLFFSVEEGSGELRVKVNDNTIYTKEIKTPGVQLIEIAKSYLREDNKLELSVSSPGVAVWSRNEYDLKEIGIKQEFERRNNEESRTFTITPKEKLNLIKAKLRYTQQCNVPLTSTVTHLDILLNDQRAHSAEIRCITTEDEVEIDSDLFIQGTNTLTFKLERGDFSFNLLKVSTESRESEKPTYFFSLTQEQYEDVKANDRKINLHLLFDQTKQMKNARLMINSNEILMQTDRNTFDRDLKDYVLEGTNFIKISPINSFNIVGLKLELE